jgi:hypothetical protein
MQYKLILILLVTTIVSAKEQFVIPQSLLNQVEKGNAEAAYFIADTFFNGSDDYQENLEQAMIWFEKAAKMGDPHAMLALADELDAEDKKSQALEWYNKAADLGMGEAMDRIAAYHYYGYAGLNKSCQTAYQWYEKAEAKHVELAFNNHAWMLATSPDKSCRNPERALKIIYDLFALYDSDESVPWNVWDTKAAVLAAVSDFGAAIKLQKWLIKKLSTFETDNTNYQLHLDSYLQRSPWIGQ